MTYKISSTKFVGALATDTAAEALARFRVFMKEFGHAAVSRGGRNVSLVELEQAAEREREAERENFRDA